MIEGLEGKLKNSAINKPLIIVSAENSKAKNNIWVGVLEKFRAIEAGRIIMEVIKKMPTILTKQATTKAVSNKNFNCNFSTPTPEICARSELIVVSKSFSNQEKIAKAEIAATA